MSRVPTIHDVARAAKVSIAAVSLVMNDPLTPRVSAAKRQNIRDIANKLGYSPNGIAKALIRGETKIVGLVIPMRDPIFFNHFIAQVLAGIQSRLIKHGYHLMIYSHQAETGQITSGEIKQSRFADGLIVLNTRMCTALDQKNTIDDLNAARIPFVMANCYSGKDPINYVGFDDYGAGKLGGEFLAAQGHRRIAFISGTKNSPMSQRLLDGFKAALRKKNLKYIQQLHVYSEYDPERIESAVEKWMDLKARPTAIFCGDDQFVPDVYRIVHSKGLAIPGDVAVLGRGNIALDSVLDPKLSTITVPGYEMGIQAAEMLLRILQNRNKSSERIILPCALVSRASV